MPRFVDEYAPDDMPTWPCASAPRWSTQVTQVDSGAEQANQRWSHPLYRFTMPEVVRTQEQFAAVRDQWLCMRGPAHTWPWRDPLDYASVELNDPSEFDPPTVAATDQTIGTGDGVTRDFQLTKTYRRGSQTYVRDIDLPVSGTVVCALNGVATTAFNVSRPGGVVTFETAPTPGQVVTAGYLFDVEVRFENDDVFEGIVQSYAVSGYASLTLVEVRPCGDAVSGGGGSF
jgi:uncharacterized protein (TIGR02217 family)